MGRYTHLLAIDVNGEDMRMVEETSDLQFERIYGRGNYWSTSDDELLAEEIQTFVWARRRRGSTRGGLGGPQRGHQRESLGSGHLGPEVARILQQDGSSSEGLWSLLKRALGLIHKDTRLLETALT